MKTAIKTNGITVSYSGIDAINNISLEINEGEFVAIIGPNGGGKTTMLNTVLGFLKPNTGTIEMQEKAVISYVPQIASMDRNFPITVLETVMTAFLKSGLHPFRRFSIEEKDKAYKLLELLGLEAFANRQIGELSGGEFQRLLIARALAANPQILLLDEPTANVDPLSRDKIFKTLKEQNLKGLTVVIVTHDLSAACSFSNKLVLINRELLYCGEPVINDEISRIMYGGVFPIEGEGEENA